MKVKKGLKNTVKRKAIKLSRKMIERAERRADDAEEYYLLKDEKRQETQKKKLAAIERMKSKTKLECQEMIENTDRQCNAKFERAKSMILQASKISNSIKKDREMIDLATDAFQNLRKSTVDHSDRAAHSEHIGKQLLRRLGFEQDRIQ